MLIHTDEKKFEEVLKKSKPLILADFFATWCGPCKMLGPELEKLAKETEDFDIIKIDIDASPSLTEKFSIEVVPTLIIFKEGKIAGRMEGFSDAKTLLNKMKQYI